MSVLKDVIGILKNVLQLQEGGQTIIADTPLIGAFPEFDSMAVVSILTALEDKFGFFVDDDEIDADVFETVNSLVTFVEGKI